MKLGFLKKIRVAVSLVFFVGTAILFLDFTHTISDAFFGPVAYLEFLPSLLKFLAVTSFTPIGFAIILILSLFFGRVYCSSVCPLGTMQDIFTFIRRKTKKRHKFKFSKPLNILRYSILILACVLFIAGFILPLNILDPYSNFGRIVTQLFRPPLIGLNNLGASLLKNVNFYWIYPVEIKNFQPTSLILPIVVSVAVVWLSIRSGRLYCNSICPVGSLLALVSKYSFFKIKIDRVNCESCADCAIVCKSSCIDLKKKEIDFTRCVNCFNCFNVCDRNALLYKFSYKKNSPVANPAPNRQRRKFLLGIGTLMLGYSGIAWAQSKVKVYTQNIVPVIKKYAVSPPGSLSIDRFNSKCTACNLCVSACPTQVLQPSFLEYGIIGMFQPRLDNAGGYCNYDCKICGDVCPTGAILPLSLEEKKLAQIGKANFVKENCIVETQKTDCGACSEHCPTKAVQMVPYNNLFLPEVRNEFCIGCGACEHACPTVPNKAIYVEGIAIHSKAQKPNEEKIEKVIDLKTDFPF